MRCCPHCGSHNIFPEIDEDLYETCYHCVSCSRDWDKNGQTPKPMFTDSSIKMYDYKLGIANDK
jgi:uncharacterized protein (DUF983 family)